MRIALDAMGGDEVPDVPVRGALEALEDLEPDFEIDLVGDQSSIQKVLHNARYPESRLSITHATEVVGMHESPSDAIRKKKDSSLSVGMKLHRVRKVDAFISAGNTGAVMVQALLDLGRLKGIRRPGIFQFFPTKQEPCAIIDLGANVDCKPIHLFHFAFMGAVCAEDVFRRKNPRIGLLNIGKESAKGNELATSTYELLRQSNLNFVGNVEGRDVFAGKADVVVCDGFVGNVALKFSESVVDLVLFVMRSEEKRSLRTRIGALLMRPAFRELQRQVVDFAKYGGAPLLGINGIVIVCHGSSTPQAIRNAIRVARLAVIHDLNEHIRQRLDALPA